MDIEWESKEKGKEKAVGVASQMTFQHSVSGDGNSETHVIDLTYSNDDHIQITISGEWEFSEFKEFLRHI